MPIAPYARGGNILLARLYQEKKGGGGGGGSQSVDPTHHNQARLHPFLKILNEFWFY